jgi:hypothetical protein
VRGPVFSRATKAEIGGQDMLFAEVIAVLEAVAPHRERHGRNSSHSIIYRENYRGRGARANQGHQRLLITNA